jgi:hypothetical protein
MESEDSCCICLESFENDSEKIMLSCNHVLHNDCLYNYMLNNYNTKTTFNNVESTSRQIFKRITFLTIIKESVWIRHTSLGSSLHS